jgi:hypothetical protein
LWKIWAGNEVLTTINYPLNAELEILRCVFNGICENGYAGAVQIPQDTFMSILDSSD